MYFVTCYDSEDGSVQHERTFSNFEEASDHAFECEGKTTMFIVEVTGDGSEFDTAEFDIFEEEVK